MHVTWLFLSLNYVYKTNFQFALNFKFDSIYKKIKLKIFVIKLWSLHFIGWTNEFLANLTSEILQHFLNAS